MPLLSINSYLDFVFLNVVIFDNWLYVMWSIYRYIVNNGDYHKGSERHGLFLI